MTEKMQRLILRILKSHNILTLATLRDDGWPQATTVTYANDGLTVYVMVGADSQKVRNISKNDKVSLTVDRDTKDWNRIRGLSMAARAKVVADPAQIQHARGLLAKKFPEVAAMTTEEDFADTAILMLTPVVISVLDYTKGFGHTDLVRV